MIFAYYILSALLIFMSYKSFCGGLNYLRYFRVELSKPAGSYLPFATVIAPLRGLDEGLAENLKAILGQNYPSFEVIFVADSPSDPAAKLASEIYSDPSCRTKIVLAPKAIGSSQKVENLREAVLHAANESKVFAFVDSDTRPAKDWLRHLVTPLEDRSVGAATGYRWFVSEKLSFGSEMRAVWNASIASALGPNLHSNFCWGGSMAIRREIFERVGMRDKWKGTLSDDFAVTRAMKEAGLAIYFVPRALTASIGSCSLHEAIEFTNRQMKITRVYAPHLWKLSYLGSVVFNLVMAASLLIVIFGSPYGVNVLIAGIVVILVSLFSIGKSWVRLNSVKLVLADRWPQVRKQWFAQNTLWMLSPALFLVNCIAATFSRKVTWRGIRYELKSPTETVIISD
jgi:ceramide glucosyltransferase